jgi:hypothetical protein
VRVDGGWQLCGALVEGAAATVIQWEQVASCPYSKSHPMVAVR